MSVALGPSLSRWHDGLQRRLGGDWLVEELICAHPPARPDDITVLGTTELPAGQIESGHSGTRTSLLIGTGSPNVQEMLDRLSAILRTLATTPAR